MTKSSNSPAGESNGHQANQSGWTRKRRLKLLGHRWAQPPVLALLRLVIGLRIEGRENVPEHGPGLIVSNHLHNADPVLLTASFPRPILFMAKKETFDYPYGIGPFARFCGAFPVNRSGFDRGALRNAERLLSEGMLVGLFPEGTRSLTGALKEVFPGAGMIAMRTGAPIIPTAIFGTETMPFNGAKGRRRAKGRTKVTIRIGKPYHIPGRQADGSRPDLKEVTDLMMTEVARLLPPEYRGIYADQVDVPQEDQNLTAIR